MKLLILLSVVCVVNSMLKFDGPEQMWSDIQDDMHKLNKGIHNGYHNVRDYMGRGVDAVRRASSYVKDQGVDAINEGFKYNPSNVVLDASRNEYNGERHVNPYL